MTSGEAVANIGVVATNVGLPRLLARRGGEGVYSGIAKQPMSPGTAL